MVTDHPYNISENIKLNHENIPGWISKWLRDKFAKFKENKMKYDKIYIDSEMSILIIYLTEEFK